VRLSLTEVSVGTLAHVLKVPGAGHALSLNQGYLLSRLLFAPGGRPRECFECSGVASTIKALASPVPQPGAILSIAMQGLLYSVGAAALGGGVLGAVLGIALLSAWAFVQPAITMWVLFGQSLFEGLLAMLAEWHITLNQAFFTLAAAWVLKSAIGTALVLRARRLGDVAAEKGIARAPVAISADAGVGRLRPLFLLSAALTIYFLLHSKASASMIVWSAVRALGVLFAMRALVQSRWLGAAIRKLVSRFAWGRRMLSLAESALSETRA